MTHIPARQPEGVPTGGQFATMTKAEPEGVVLGQPTPAADIDGLIAGRDDIREARDEASDNNDSAHVFLDRQVQHASIQLAAAAVRRDYPGAAMLMLRDNEDGENQYEIMAVVDKDFNDLASAETDNEWAHAEIGGTNSPSLSELAWSLDVNDHSWADGIAKVADGRYATVVTVDLDAALTKPAPAQAMTPRQRTNAAAERFTELADTRARAEEQIRMIDAATQHASVQLLSASVMERYPSATRLNLMDDTDGTGGFKAISVMDAEGLILEFGSFSKDTIFNQYVPGGAAKLSDLAQGLQTEDPAWAEGIASFQSDGHRTYASVDLAAAVTKQVPQARR